MIYKNYNTFINQQKEQLRINTDSQQTTYSDEQTESQGKMSMNHKVCAFFNVNNDEDHECQARFFLERNDGKFLITNMLKFKKEQDFIFREGFGEKIQKTKRLRNYKQVFVLKS